MSEFQGPGVDKLGVTRLERERLGRFLRVVDNLLGLLTAPTASQLLIDRNMSELRVETKTTPERDGE